MPLIAIAPADGTDSYILLRDKSDRCHFKNYWGFTPQGYRFNDQVANGEGVKDYPEWNGVEYDYKKGLRGDPDVESENWPDLTISYDCGQDQFCAIMQHTNMSDLEFKVP